LKEFIKVSITILSLIPNIIETVIPQTTYLWKVTIAGNFKALSDPDRFLIDKLPVIIYRLVGRFAEFLAKDSNI